MASDPNRAAAREIAAKFCEHDGRYSLPVKECAACTGIVAAILGRHETMARWYVWRLTQRIAGLERQVLFAEESGIESQRERDEAQRENARLREATHLAKSYLRWIDEGGSVAWDEPRPAGIDSRAWIREQLRAALDTKGED